MKRQITFLCLLLTAMLFGGCATQEGFIDPILTSRLYTDQNNPCISMLFPFDVTMDNETNETVSGINIRTRYMHSKDYNIRIIKMNLSRGFFRSKALGDVYQQPELLYQRGYDNAGNMSAAIVRQKTGQGCEYIKGRIENRAGDRYMVDIDFRRRLTPDSDIEAEKKKMISTINSVFDKMSVSLCVWK